MLRRRDAAHEQGAPVRVEDSVLGFCLRRVPLRVPKQRSLPVHRPAGRVHRPGEPLQPGPGQQASGPHVLRGPARCFSSRLLCSSIYPPQRIPHASPCSRAVAVYCRLH